MEVPVPSVLEVTIMAPSVDTAGRTWYWISSPDVGEAGAGNGPPPQRAAGGGAERGGGVRDVRWPTGTEDSSTGDAASQPGGAAGRTGAGAAAHHGAGCRLRAGGPAARCSCAADGGQVGGCAEDRRPLRPRAGDRSAQDLKPCPPPRRVLLVPQTTEQLVEVPLPATGVVQAWV